ncbi:MAG TPA: class I SAM-dependent DNA methyltransferase [Methanocorpusculum sp.]|nr:class I SAM-dependent DNA methyltransferase [Methanocorpusculum sp.]
MASINSFVKSMRNTMWKDSGASSDLQRLPQLSWLLFLKVYDERESEWELEGNYQSIIPENLRWRNWAKDTKDKAVLKGDELISFVNNELLPGLKNIPVSSKTPVRQLIVPQMFADTENYMKDGVLLRQVITAIDEIDFEDYDEQHAFNEIYESILKNMQGSKATGEFYTPRGVTDFVVEMVKPKLGDRVADFACGTGGFLVSAMNALEPQLKGGKDVSILQSSIYGCEWKALPYQMCMTNMILHGLDSPDLINGDSLSRNVREFAESEKYDVIVMNPPYGGNTSRNTLENFPADLRTSETAFLFVILILYRLKKNGRVGIVLSDGFMQTSSPAELRIIEKLLEECNLHTVVRLPESVFSPYTSIATNLLFFDKTGPTKETWFYRLDMPEGYKHFSKTKPIASEHFEPVRVWWKNRCEIEDVKEDDDASVSYKAKRVSIAEIRAKNFSLDFCGFPHESEVILPPGELLAEYHRQKSLHDKKIEEILGELMVRLEK